MKSPKETKLEKSIINLLQGRALQIVEALINDEEIKHLQDYANIVSIKRLGFNDHGPVHMRKVSHNALLMLNLLKESTISLNLEKEGIGNFEDCQIAVLLASFLHDIGMSIGRQNHEKTSAMLALPIIDRILADFYHKEPEKKYIIRTMALEGILGHMATQKIHSLEAGIILIADGCDMEKGRARIPMMLFTEAHMGDIHKYSSSSIKHVFITKGEKKPIRISVEMEESVGFFQIEEVLLPKINFSPIKQYIELFAGVTGREMKCYL